MAIITAGYDGTVDETQFAEILHRYSVVGPDDFKATTQAGDRIVAISDGVALGPGTRDVATGIAPIQFAVASGTRWDLVVLRRDWQPPGGATTVEIVQGGSTRTFPAVGTAGTNWNRRPGIVDDQPLYLQEVNGTLLGQRVDLRCWAGHGGLFAKDDLVRTYLDRVGADIDVNGSVWTRRLGANDIPEWVKGSRVVNASLIDVHSVTGLTSVTTNTNGDVSIPVPSVLSTVTSVQLTDATSSVGGPVLLKWTPATTGTTVITCRAFGTNGSPLPGYDLQISWTISGQS